MPLTSTEFARTLAQAQDASQSENWELAAPLWAAVTGSNPVNGSYWNHLGTAREHLHDHQGALDALDHVFRIGDEFRSHAAGRIARCHALLGQSDAALSWLDRAISMGLHDLDALRNDDAFAALQEDPTFRALIGLVDDESDRDERWRVDVRFAAREIKRRAFAPFSEISESAFNETVERIVDRIPELTDHQIILELARLLRKLNDGHARIRVPEDRADLQRAAPISTFLFGNDLAIVAAPPEHEDLLGATIVAVGDTPIADVLSVLDEVITRDNDNEQWFKACLPDWFVQTSALHALNLIPSPDRLPLTIRDRSGSSRAVVVEADPAWPAHKLRSALPFPPTWPTLHGMGERPIPHYLRNPSLPFWFDFLPETRTVYAQFNAVRDTQHETIEAFGHRLFAFIDAHDIDRLALDMRWNGGGNTLREWPFLHQILANRRINRQGSLFVIIGRGTFSAAQNGVSFLATHTNATFVGEPTGSSPQFIGETNYFTLPYSKVIMNVSDLHWVGTWPGDERKWLPPTIYAPPTFASYRENRDPALDAILGLTERLPGV